MGEISKKKQQITFLRDYLNYSYGPVKPVNSLSMIINFLDTEGSHIEFQS